MCVYTYISLSIHIYIYIFIYTCNTILLVSLAPPQSYSSAAGLTQSCRSRRHTGRRSSRNHFRCGGGPFRTFMYLSVSLSCPFPWAHVLSASLSCAVSFPSVLSCTVCVAFKYCPLSIGSAVSLSCTPPSFRRSKHVGNPLFE